LRAANAPAGATRRTKAMLSSGHRNISAQMLALLPLDALEATRS
jgi:hypothetical protein